MMKSFRSSGSISSIGLIGNIVLALGLLAACTAPPPRVKVLPPANVPAKIDQTKPPVKIDTEGLDELQEAAKEAAGEAAKPGEESEGGLSEAANEAAERKGREELYRLMRTYPGDSIPEGVRQKGYEVLQTQLAAQALQNKPEANAWQPIGPSPIRDEAMGEAVKVNSAGRATAILVNPQNPNIVYVAGAQGGVWKTTNGGDTWTPLTDGQPSLAIGTMTFDPNNAEIIYVGTGEPHGSDSYYGAGILKSSNGGTSWTQLGADTFGGLGIADIVISRNDPNTLYVAASDAPSGYTKKPLAQRPGIYKSTDGGVSWTRVVDVCDTQGLCASMSALVVSPTDPNTLYAGVDFVGVLKTTNAGANWASVLSFDNTVNVGRVEVAISPANANTLFAGIEINQDDGSSYGFLFKATDGGTKWDQISGFPNSTKPLKDSYCGGQCNYDNAIVFHPTNANIVFAGGNAKYSQSISGIDGALFKTTDGGTTWSFNNGKAANTTLHPDLHAIAFSKSNPSIMWVGTDGGVYRSTDGGGTWQDRNTGLATLQFQSVALHPTNPQIAFGGMQDNAKAKTTDGSTWLGLDVGDGGFVAIDPFDPKYWYGTRFSISGQVVQLQRNANNGSAPVEDWPEANTGINIKSDRVLFYVPFTTDPNTAGRLYLGTNRLYRTNNRADSWTAISGDMTKGTGRGISAITVMRGNANIVLLGTSDGNVQVTTNGGTSFTNITKAPLPNRFVADVAVENAQTFYVAFNGFNANTQTTPGHIFKTTDGGTTWSNVSKDGAADGLPDLPVQAMVLDGSAVYVGTDLGVYRSLNGGTSWEPFNQGMPNVAIFDLAIQKYASGAKVLAAATHGRSIWRIVLEGDITPSFKNKLFVPLVMREAKNLPQPTVTPGPSPTPIPSATTGPTPTTTPTQQPGGSTATPTSTPTQPAGNTATPTPTNTPATNPPTQTPTTPAQSGRISGVVRANGAGISGIKLRLLNCSLESNCTSVQTATSTTGGQYQFDNPPALQSGDYYRVSYYNDSDGNPNDTTKLTFWRGPSVDAFASGDVANGGTFDIKDVVLSSPLGGVSRALPTSFTWVSRSISGDSYTWQMAEFTAPSTVGAELCFDSVGTLTTSTITSSDLLDVTICDGAYNTEYAWYVYVFTTANNGYGASYYYRTVTFTSSAQVAGTPAENSQSTMARSKELRTTPPLEEAK